MIQLFRYNSVTMRYFSPLGTQKYCKCTICTFAPYSSQQQQHRKQCSKCSATLQIYGSKQSSTVYDQGLPYTKFMVSIETPDSPQSPMGQSYLPVHCSSQLQVSTVSFHLFQGQVDCLQVQQAPVLNMAAEWRHVERPLILLARKTVSTCNDSQQQCFKMQYTHAIKRFHVLSTKCDTTRP